MGFEGKKVLNLTFADPQYAELEVAVRRPTIDQVIAMSERRDLIREAAETSELALIEPLAELFCSLLVGWNLENDGEPVPHDAKALLAQDFDVTQTILKAWEDNAITVSAPLEQGSSGGEPSLAASIPMETLSASRAS